MRINIDRIPGKYNGKECYVHARAQIVNDSQWIMISHKLDVSGSDLFYGLSLSESRDGGKTWSDPVEQKELQLNSEEPEYRYEPCDPYHLYHKATGKVLTIGAVVKYEIGGKESVWNDGDSIFYAVYDPSTGKYNKVNYLHITSVNDRKYTTGSAEFIETDSGELLIPVVAVTKGATIWDAKYSSLIVRCRFDGKNLEYLEKGNELFFNVGRGLYEPQLCYFQGKYYLSMRNDEHALYAVSDDGLHFSQPTFWRWDTDVELPTYNTQQHWLICDRKLHLVYTRKAGNNDHVFRHRAPLFMAQVDTDRMCIMRHTEQIVAYERGARLGNFGVTFVNENKSVICAAEWMQPLGCERYGSDNSIWFTTVTADEYGG